MLLFRGFLRAVYGAWHLLEETLGILEEMVMLLEFEWTWSLGTLLFVAKNGRETSAGSFIRTMVSDIRRSRSDIR